MLIAFIALVALVNWMLLPSRYLFGDPLTLQQVFGWLFSPVAWILGVPWQDAHSVGILLGEKTVVNEFVAFSNLGRYELSPRSLTIATYALCGFANFASIGIQLGGIGGIAPERLPDLSRVALRAMAGGFLAACMTGAVAGVFLG